LLVDIIEIIIYPIKERIMKIKYQIFISSTYEDLKDVREQLIKCILEMGHIPVGMEMFSAANEDQWKIIQKQIDECDYYTVIVAHRYGSLDKGISYTEKEYNYAVSKDVPVLGFIIDETTKWSSRFIDKEEATVEKLNLFKEKIKTKMISFWKSTEDIYGKFAVSLGKAISAHERPGYIRANEVANIDVYNEVTRLSNENSKLRNEINQINTSFNNNEEQKRLELLKTLEINKRVVPIFFQGEREWNMSNNVTYLKLFEIIAEILIIEANEVELKEAIAFGVSGKGNYKKTNPVPNNWFNEWMADLNVLDLIEQSKKSHSLSDNSKYWTLTDAGRGLFKNLRKLKLISGIREIKGKLEEKPEK
jgi:hypothetical protein